MYLQSWSKVYGTPWKLLCFHYRPCSMMKAALFPKLGPPPLQCCFKGDTLSALTQHCMGGGGGGGGGKEWWNFQERPSVPLLLTRIVVFRALPYHTIPLREYHDSASSYFYFILLCLISLLISQSMNITVVYISQVGQTHTVFTRILTHKSCWLNDWGNLSLNIVRPWHCVQVMSCRNATLGYSRVWQKPCLIVLMQADFMGHLPNRQAWSKIFMAHLAIDRTSGLLRITLVPVAQFLLSPILKLVSNSSYWIGPLD